MERGAGQPDEVPALPLPLLLTILIVAVSLSAIFIRLADAPGTVIAFYRLAFASVLTFPAMLRGLRGSIITARGVWLSVIAGIMLGWHFATWTTSLEYTSIAASVTLVTTTPLWIVLILWLFRGRRPAGRTLAGVLTAVAGGTVIGLDGQLGTGSASDTALLGNLLALAGAVTVGLSMLAGGAAQRSGLRVMAYSGISCITAAVSLAPLPALLGHSYWPYTADVLLWIALLALVSQLVGHTSMNYSLRFLDPTFVATVILLEPVVASLLAMVIFGEVPGLLTAAGALVLLGGVVLVNSGMRSRAVATQKAP